MAKQKTQVADTPGLDPALPSVTLILGGIERHPVFDWNAICLAEKHTGTNILKLFSDAWNTGLDATSTRILLWATLLKEQPDLTIEEVGFHIGLHNLSTIHEALITAWLQSTEQAGQGHEPDPKPKAQGKK